MNKKIFRSSLLTVCLVLIATIALIMGLLYHFFEKQIQTELANEAGFLAQAVENEGTGYFDGFDSDGKNHKVQNNRITLIDKDGAVLFALVGKAWMHYDFTVVLSHFKGHPMAGFGGALKNIGIGLQSQQGKVLVHSAGRTTDMSVVWTPEYSTPQDDFLESMAEACKADLAHAGENILFINVANNLSVDCDCVATPEKPEMTDLGIFASLDPVAVDRACVDAVYSSPDHGKKHLIERMESRNATHLLDYAEQLGLGTQSYELVELEGEPNGAVL